MPAKTCSCGMSHFPVEGDPTPFSLDWTIKHRERHLAAFPDLDPVTRANLDDFVRWASICD